MTPAWQNNIIFSANFEQKINTLLKCYDNNQN